MQVALVHDLSTQNTTSDCPRFSYATKNRGILRFFYPPKPGFSRVKNRFFCYLLIFRCFAVKMTVFSCSDVVGCSLMRTQSLIRISLTCLINRGDHLGHLSRCLQCACSLESLRAHTVNIGSYVPNFQPS